MKVFAVLSFVSVAFAGINVFEARNCAGNNCNRAITGTRAGLPATSLRQSDCSSFMLTVVTPSPVFSTTWVEAPANGKAKRATTAAVTAAVTSTPTALPTYATQCSSAAAYASACSCWGITAGLSTAAVPTVTVTSTYDYCDL
ncbi:hypothetical protein CMQ_6692 [Grosmannia clavigera kw1407]|uniref:Uncharacterized protein n=1 Tax=Grosmannia clavigera (strain kw1407 / UAMH 11150) TaxID=655863 RepID=F0X6Q8_GROCL|nr:uncharacterized protein CMQ_6692 [Grosmannia clavigera kw1407]EFX06371.1 hypothetical protein CMQ_6692 [Grosmannia clavigera kw1407]